MAIDPAAEILALTADIARQTAIIDSGVTQSADATGRMARIDLRVVQDSRSAKIARLAFLLGTPPQVRRIFVSTPRRGY